MALGKSGLSLVRVYIYNWRRRQSPDLGCGNIFLRSSDRESVFPPPLEVAKRVFVQECFVSLCYLK